MATENYKKLWDSLGDLERNAVLFLVHTTPPTSLDELISLTGISAVQAVNVMDTLKDKKIVHEKKGHGKGVYFLSGNGFTSAITQWVKDEEKQHVLQQIVDYYLDRPDENEKNILSLADLYYQLGDPQAGTRHIKDAAQILYKSGQSDRAVAYHDYLLRGFSEKGVTRDNARDFLDTVLDKVKLTMTSMPIREAIPLLEKALETARKYRMRDRELKIKIALLYKVQASGDEARTAELLADVRKMSARIEDPPFFITVTLCISDVLARMGRFKEAIEQYERVAGDLEKHAQDESDLIAMATIGNKYVLCGQIRKGMELIASVGAKAEALSLPNAAVHVEMLSLYNALEMRKTEQTRACLERMRRMVKNEPDNAHLSVAINFAEAYICYAMGDYPEALAFHRKGLEYVAAAGIENLFWGWGLEYLSRLEQKGFLSDRMSVAARIEDMLTYDHVYRKGLALKHRALRLMERQAPFEQVLSDLDQSEAYLEEAGAEIELARTRLIRGKLFVEKGDMKIARYYFDRVFGFLSRMDKDLFPDDLLAMMPLEAKAGLLTDKITRINQSLGPDLDIGLYLEQMLTVAMDFTMASRGAILSVDGSRFRMLAGRNLDADLFIMDQFAPCQQAILEAVRNEEELFVPGDLPAVNDSFRAAGITSMIGVPVKLRKDNYGYLLLGNQLGGEPFYDSLFSFVRMVCSQIALGLSNLHAFQKIAELREQLANRTALPGPPGERSCTPIDTITGKSKGIKRVKDRIRQVAGTDSSVLLLGETGVGKELAAKAIHQLSERKEGPFIAVNIAALPQELAASELFGHEKGSFTGAHVRNKGRFELADGGTIFLDEIGELSIPLQVRLLRVLQEGVFERLGSSKPIHSNFRVIAATNKNLIAEVEKGTFREDLYYRLNVFPIEMPPLRQREGDIALLARHFIDTYARKMGKSVSVSKSELRKLDECYWPGNVRELKHFIEKAVILCDGGELDLSDCEVAADRSAPREPRRLGTLSDMEKAYITEVLAASGGRVKGPGGAAEILGMRPSTLYYRMKKLGIK